MSLIGRISQTFRFGSGHGDGMLRRLFGLSNEAGEVITTDSVMGISAVYRAVQLNAETVASLPANIFVETDSGPTLARGSQVDTLVRVSPNADQTPMEFWEQLFGCAELYGEGMALKHWNDARTRVVAITPLHPLRMRDIDNPQRTAWYWEYTDFDGNRHQYSPDDVLHMPGFSLSGRRGMSRLEVARQALGLAQSADRTAASMFRRGLRNAGFLETNTALTDDQRKQLEGHLEKFTGPSGSGSLMVLEGGMKFAPLTMSARDAELLMSRKFQIEEIGRYWGTPPVLLGHAVEGQTMWGTGVDSIIQSWQTLGLNHRLRRYQAAIQKRLMTPAERAEGLYVRYNADALLAVNSTARINFITQAVQNSILTPNEGRALLERGAMAGGDKLLAQVNLALLENLGDNEANQVQKARDAIRTLLLEGPKNEPAKTIT